MSEVDDSMIPNYTMFGVHQASIEVFKTTSPDDDKVRYNAAITFYLDDANKWGEYDKLITLISEVWSTDPIRCAYMAADQIAGLVPVSTYVMIVDGDLSPAEQIGYFLLDEVEEEGITWETPDKPNPTDWGLISKPRNSNLTIVK